MTNHELDLNQQETELIKGVVDLAISISRRGLSPEAVAGAIADSSIEVANGVGYVASNGIVDGETVKQIAEQLKATR